MPVRNEAGFTLIEAMIASVILAVGLLALSFMQATTLSRNGDSNELTRATSLASEMVERIRFNRSRVTAYNNPGAGGIGITSAGGGNCSTISAANEPMARGDCDQWVALLNGPYGAGLSGLVGTVSVAPNGPTAPPMNQSLVTVRISWTTAAGLDKLARSRQVVINTTIAPE
jgi:type IV pilus assembly protein PilV